MLISLIGVCSKCHKKLDCREVIYDFDIGIKSYPDKDSINIGDTLWLEVNVPTTLKNLQTGQMIDYGDAANLGTAISFAQLISVNSTTDQVAAKFKYLLIYGSEIKRSDSTKYREFRFFESSGYYKFKLGLIPKESGVFKMFVANAFNVYRRNDECTKANFVINFTDTNQHFYLNEVSFPGIILSGKNGVYLFKVK